MYQAVAHFQILAPSLSLLSFFLPKLRPGSFLSVRPTHTQAPPPPSFSSPPPFPLSSLHSFAGPGPNRAYVLSPDCPFSFVSFSLGMHGPGLPLLSSSHDPACASSFSLTCLARDHAQQPPHLSYSSSLPRIEKPETEGKAKSHDSSTPMASSSSLLLLHFMFCPVTPHTRDLASLLQFSFSSFEQAIRPKTGESSPSISSP